MAQNIGDLFGNHFRLPVTDHLISVRTRNEHEHGRIMETLMRLETPYVWCKDATIMAFEAFNTGFQESEAALEILRSLVNRQHGKGAKRHAKAAEARIPPENEQPKSAQKAEVTAATSSRMSYVAKGLYIDMIGWDPKSWVWSSELVTLRLGCSRVILACEDGIDGGDMPRICLW